MTTETRCPHGCWPATCLACTHGLAPALGGSPAPVGVEVAALILQHTQTILETTAKCFDERAGETFTGTEAAAWIRLIANQVHKVTAASLAGYPTLKRPTGREDR